MRISLYRLSVLTIVGAMLGLTVWTGVHLWTATHLVDRASNALTMGLTLFLGGTLLVVQVSARHRR